MEGLIQMVRNLESNLCNLRTRGFVKTKVYDAGGEEWGDRPMIMRWLLSTQFSQPVTVKSPLVLTSFDINSFYLEL